MLSNVSFSPVFNCAVHGSTLICKLSDDLRATRYQEKQHQYNKIMSQIGEIGQPRMVFDLSACSAMDSITLGMLVSLTKECIRFDGQVALCCLSDDLRETLRGLMLLEPRHRQLTWMVYGTIDEAVQSFHG